ncbi:hypothetical protein B0H16DRAFT_1722520 [Mycena metata]|uniref:Uncharacterized protein n=1 Tax=Mycena metata TaxID=1033252 RepID=A0AAD7NCA6_9AGAR|nr:hypothetical protein B0H16DRAFT_1722520 [Mycena metata]
MRLPPFGARKMAGGRPCPPKMARAGREKEKRRARRRRDVATPPSPPDVAVPSASQNAPPAVRRAQNGGRAALLPKWRAQGRKARRARRWRDVATPPSPPNVAVPSPSVKAPPAARRTRNGGPLPRRPKWRAQGGKARRVGCRRDVATSPSPLDLREIPSRPKSLSLLY